MRQQFSDRQSPVIESSLSAVGFATAGAALMYVLDPNRGHRRRMLIRDKMFHAGRQAFHTLTRSARFMGGQARGWIARLRAAIAPDYGDDWTVRARVRSAIGRAVSHPHAIEVVVRGGRVILAGPVLSQELNRLLKTARRVRGVKSVENMLDVYDNPGDIPGLQGPARSHNGRHKGILRGSADSTTRLISGIGGAATLAWGTSRRDLTGALAGAFGAAMLVRSLMNPHAKRETAMNAIGSESDDLFVSTTIIVDAPMDSVFDVAAPMM